MNQLQEQITQYRKMASEDPDNELGHFRLGQLLMEDGQLEEAVRSFRRTLQLSPQFSKVFHLLGSCLSKLNRRDEAVEVLRQGIVVADQRGDQVPREAIAKLLVQLGEPAPEPQRLSPAPDSREGFRCLRPGCQAGAQARQLPKPPMNDAMGQKVFENTCADCWDYWRYNLSIKVINEMRLDLSTERGQEIYDQILRETLAIP